MGELDAVAVSLIFLEVSQHGLKGINIGITTADRMEGDGIALALYPGIGAVFDQAINVGQACSPRF
jgi:hypothetical protein